MPRSARTTHPLRDRRPELAVAAGACRLSVDASGLGVATTAEVPPPDGTVGQERAVAALELGLRLRRRGYDVVVAGPVGTGRRSTVRSMLGRIAATLPVPPDRAYVHRFGDPDRPRLLTLPPGDGARFAAQVDELREALLARAPALVDDREVDRRQEAIQQRYGGEEDRALAALRERLTKDGFALVPVAMGAGVVVPEVAPLHRGKPVPMPEMQGRLPAEEYADLERRLEAHAAEVRAHLRDARTRKRRFVAEIRMMLADVGAALVDDELRGIESGGLGEDARAFLDDVREDAIAAIVELIGPGPGTIEMFLARADRYRVNVVADRSGLAGAPVVEEGFPSRRNLAGVVERVQDGPLSWRADATTIRSGSLLRADGGFLVILVADLLEQPGAWPQLKRALTTGVLEPGSLGPGVLGLPRAIEPDPVRIDAKVVLIGERWAYDLLSAVDPEFRRLFGVRADFAADMRMGPDAVRRYAAVIAKVCGEEGLLPVEPGGLGALIEEGVRLAGRRNRISTVFAKVADLLREASFVAEGAGRDVVGRDDVAEAARRREHREGEIPQRLQDMLTEGVLIVATDGRAQGQVNGLSVLDLGYQAFGKPTRITASAAPGRAGVISIEREARLSGGVYDKGVLTIGGYLRRRYADLGPLSLTASLSFEQSYAGVDGDSASIAEVIALLSELAGRPVDQAIAVTGSINQHGEAQPVGGVNEKIVAFHGLCAARGLDGSHGVVVPARNLSDLMLPARIVDDVAAGAFHLRAVDSVEQALEIALDAPIATIDAAVRRTLQRFAAALARAAGDLEAGVPPAAPPVVAPAPPES